MNLCVIGTGYVGLVTGTIFSDLGNHVCCVDNVVAKVEGLRNGIMPIYEPGLEELVVKNVKAGRLTFTTDLISAVKASEVVFICVGTPPSPSGEPDMKYVRAVAEEIAKGLDKYTVIVNKSTVPVGTGNLVRDIIEANLTQPVPFDVVSNPEFLREGSAIYDTLKPDRVVIGASSAEAGAKVASLYAPLHCAIQVTDVASAEIIKYASNSFLATKISFMNAVSALCELTGANVEEVSEGMGSDSRIGRAFLNAGLGYGGSCFPKDCLGLYHVAKKFGYDFHLMKSVMQINAEQPIRFISRLRTVLGGFEGKRIGLWGLAFKPNTDDIREAKSLEIIEALLQEGAEVCAYDPIAIEGVKSMYPQVEYCANAQEVAVDADALLLITEWNEFKEADMAQVLSVMKRGVLFDGRNIYSPAKMKQIGFEYHSIGR